MEQHEGFGSPAADAEGTETRQPERDLLPGNPILMGAAPAEEKRGITGRVKDLVVMPCRKLHEARNQDATASAGDTDPAPKRGVLRKIKVKASSTVGTDKDGSKHGPARLLSMSSSSSISSSDEEDIGTVGSAMDPTGPAVAGSTLGREDFSSAPAGPGADFRDLTLSSGDDDDANGDAKDQHSERAAQFAKTSNPMHPSYGEARSSHPTETSNSTLTLSEGDNSRSLTSETSNSTLTPNDDAGDGLRDHSRPTEMDNNRSASEAGEPHPSEVGEHNGNLHDGPRGDSMMQEGFVRKIADSVH